MSYLKDVSIPRSKHPEYTLQNQSFNIKNSTFFQHNVFTFCFARIWDPTATLPYTTLHLVAQRVTITL